MKPAECEFEAEVLSAVLASCWPQRADPVLVAHAAGCALCSEVAAISAAMDAGRDEVAPPEALPDSGRVWWVAQHRARLEAADAANRPIRTAQAVALVCALVAVCSYFGVVALRFQAAFERMALGAGGPNVAEKLAATTRFVAGHAGLALALAAVALLVPAAAYFAIGRE